MNKVLKFLLVFILKIDIFTTFLLFSFSNATFFYYLLKNKQFFFNKLSYFFERSKPKITRFLLTAPNKEIFILFTIYLSN